MNDRDYILFENYLSGTLSEEENLAFETALQADDDFKQAFDVYCELSAFLKHKISDEGATQAFKSNLGSISQKRFSNKGEKSVNIRFRSWHYAAVASVLVVFGAYFYNRFSVPNYADFAVYEPIGLTVRGSQNELTFKAENAFNTKDYGNAAIYFQQLLVNDTSNVEFQLYKAISYVELNNFEEADIIFKEISDGSSAYTHTATWYAALSKLKQKDYRACATLLGAIPKEAAEYGQAQKLFKKLK